MQGRLNLRIRRGLTQRKLPLRAPFVTRVLAGSSHENGFGVGFRGYKLRANESALKMTADGRDC